MKNEPKKRLRSVPASEARELLKEQRQSALNIATFARSRGVKPWSLYNAQALERRRTERASRSRLAEVQVVDTAAPYSSTAAIELALPSGMSIRVTRDFDEVALRRVLGVLSSC
jgi:hypothetical protein